MIVRVSCSLATSDARGKLRVTEVKLQTSPPCCYNLLVGGLEHFIFFHILGTITPTDFHIFRGVETTNQFSSKVWSNPEDLMLDSITGVNLTTITSDSRQC
jgi:hypothetical protein